jgi:hypothetical protein
VAKSSWLIGQLMIIDRTQDRFCLLDNDLLLPAKVCGAAAALAGRSSSVGASVRHQRD